MGYALVDIGYGNVVARDRVIAVVAPGSAPIKRLKDAAREKGKLIDASQGRPTRAVIITDSDHVVLSARRVETIAQLLSETTPPPSTDQAKAHPPTKR